MSINKLVALAQGNPSNSKGSDVADAVNGFSSIQDIPNVVGGSAGVSAKLVAWRAGGNGGGVLTWEPSLAKSKHNGGTVFSPTVPYANDFDYMDGVGETDPSGSGCWVRVGATDASHFGAYLDGATNDTGYIQRYFDHAKENHVFNLSGESVVDSLSFNGHTYCKVNASSWVGLPSGLSTCLVIDNMLRCDVDFGGFGMPGYMTQGAIPYEIKSTIECKITIGSSIDFTAGALINPVGDSGGLDPSRTVVASQYNEFYLKGIGSSTNTTNALTITTTAGLNPAPSIAASWFNENQLFLGDIKCTDYGVIFVKGTGQLDQFNGNLFFKPGFEDVGKGGLALAFAENNSVIHPRFEDESSNFSEFTIKDNFVTNDCGYNIFHVNRATYANIQLTGFQNQVYGALINSAGDHLGERYIVAGPGKDNILFCEELDVNTSNIQNSTLFINGNTVDTGNNSALEKYRGYWKNSSGSIEPYGLMNPIDQLLISSATSGETKQAGKVSFIRVQGAATDFSIQMNTNREINGYTCILEIRDAAAQVTIKNSAGTDNIASTAFQTGGDSRGLFILIYRDFAWRTSRIGEILINA